MPDKVKRRRNRDPGMTEVLVAQEPGTCLTSHRTFIINAFLVMGNATLSEAG